MGTCKSDDGLCNQPATARYKNEFDKYADSIRLSMMLITLLFTIFLIVRIRFGETKLNALTLKPYYIALIYALTQMTITFLTQINHTWTPNE